MCSSDLRDPAGRHPRRHLRPEGAALGRPGRGVHGRARQPGGRPVALEEVPIRRPGTVLQRGRPDVLLEPLEKRIEERESRRAEIDGKLCSPEVLADSSLVQRLMIERKSLDDALAADYETWEALTSALEAIG